MDSDNIPAQNHYNFILYWVSKESACLTIMAVLNYPTAKLVNDIGFEYFKNVKSISFLFISHLCEVSFINLLKLRTVGDFCDG